MIEQLSRGIEKKLSILLEPYWKLCLWMLISIIRVVNKTIRRVLIAPLVKGRFGVLLRMIYQATLDSLYFELGFSRFTALECVLALITVLAWKFV